MIKSFRMVCLLSFATLLLPLQSRADVNVLIIGSTHDTSEYNTSASSVPFSPSPTSIATYLQNILQAADGGTVKVATRERYATATTILGQTTYAFNLASWYHWPFPKGSETNRWADLRGEAGTNWNYVVLIGDPYTIEYTPGLYAHGVAQIANEVAKGSGETILLMSWPSGAHSSVEHYKEVVYRAGRSGGYKVAPAGLAWVSAAKPTGNNAAYLAAATIYSRIYGQNAKNTGYTYNNSMADAAYTAVTNNVGKPQYTGVFSFQNPYLMKKDTRREIYFSAHGSSTEDYFKGAAGDAIRRCNIGVTSFFVWNTTYDAYLANGGTQQWLTWPTNTPLPIAWNHGRDPATVGDWWKGYIIETNHWDFAYGFRYHQSTWAESVDDANAHYVGQMLNHDNELTHRMLSQGNSVRSIPVRHLWAQFHKIYPTANPQSDGTGPHLSTYENEAVGTYMYTLYSGRCSLNPEPDPLDKDKDWVAQKIGYETAWQLGRCQTRAPGFKVMPVKYSYSNVTATVSQTLSVQFILAPTSDVTVAVSSDDNYRGWANPSVLRFTPQNYSTPQIVTVIGAPGPAGLYPFNVTLTTSSADEVYDGLSDSWNFYNSRSSGSTPADIRIKGNDVMIASGDTTPSESDSTFFGYANGSITKTFVITNQSSSTTVNLTGSPNRVSVTSSGGHFSLTQDASVSSLTAGSATTFSVTYAPQSMGVHTATVSVASSDVATPVYTFRITGVNPSTPTVVASGAVALGNTRATLSGVLSSGGYANVWFCWGNEDGGTTSTGLWDHVQFAGGMTNGMSFSTVATGLVSNVTYWYRCYASSTGGVDWTDSALAFSGTPAAGGVLVPVTNGLVAHWDATRIQGVTNGGQVAVWVNSANPGTYDLTLSGGSPTYRAAVTNLGGRPAVEFAAGGDDWFGFSEISTIRTVFWVIHDSYATSGAQLLLGHSSAKDFYSGGNQFWGLGTASEAVKCGITQVNGISVDGTTVNRPTTPALVSLVTTANAKANQLSQDRASAGSGWEGKMAEVLIYDKALSQEDREAVGSYLAAKYRLTTSYPSAPSDSGVIINVGASEIATGSAVLNGVLDAHDGAYAVTAYWGTTDGGTNPVAWTTSCYVGSFTNVGTDVSCSVSGLAAGHDYYYTFMASNATGTAWASPSWSFRAAGQTADTCMLTVRSAHGTAVPAGVTEQLSNSVVNVSIIDSPVINGNNRYVCTGWVGTGSVTNGNGTNMSFTITRDSSIAWVWSTNLIVIPVPVVSTEAGGVPASQTSAVLRGVLSSGETAQAWFCWGTSDGGIASTGDWQHVVSVGGVNEGVAFSNLVTGLSTNTTYYYRCYATNAYGSDWSDTVETFSGTPGGGAGGGASDPVGGAYFEWDAARNTPGGSNWTSTGSAAYDWTFDAGNQTPSVVSDTRFDRVTKAYVFPAAKDASNSTWQNQGDTEPATFEFVLDVDSLDGSIFEMGGSGDGVQVDIVGGVIRGTCAETTPARVSYTLTTNDLTRFIHVVFVADQVGNTVKLYIDGELKDSQPWTLGEDWAGPDEGSLGGVANAKPSGGSSVAFAGKIALFRYYRNKAFTSGEVLQNFAALSTVGGSIANAAPTDITNTTAVLNASLNAAGTSYDVYLHYGLSDGGTNAGSWNTRVYVGSWTNNSTNISYAVNGLVSGTMYHYAFMASNVTKNAWASPSWTFRTLGVAPAVTVNHAVPHAWLSSINPSWSTNYEAAVMSDPDGDGFTTWQEYWSGTDPLDNSSCLKIDSIEMNGADLVIKWRHTRVDAGIPPITIQARSNLVSGSWVGIGTRTPINGINTWSAGSSVQGFYRLAVTNAP
jgi:hypothetical protein